MDRKTISCPASLNRILSCRLLVRGNQKRRPHHVPSHLLEGHIINCGGLSAVQALYNLTDQILELHRLDNSIKSTFGQQPCSPLENSVRPYQQEMSRVNSVFLHNTHSREHARSLIINSVKEENDEFCLIGTTEQNGTLATASLLVVISDVSVSSTFCSTI